MQTLTDLKRSGPFVTILYKRAGSADVLEGQVMAFSAENKYVKLDESGKWLATDTISLLEILHDPAPPAAAAPVILPDPPATDPGQPGETSGVDEKPKDTTPAN